MADEVGIKEVAAAAGVSVTTVSHALSGKGRLGAATRERVRRVARELGYRPNAPARNLATRRQGLLGLAISQPSGEALAVHGVAYFVSLLNAATVAALEHGYALVLSAAGEDATTPLMRAGVDGAIVVDPLADDALVRRLRAARLPLVTTGRIPGEDAEADPWVDNDFPAATLTTLEHLAERGAGRVAMIGAGAGPSYARDAAQAYGAWCARRGQAPLLAQVPGALTESAGFNAAWELLRGPEPPDAIYAAVDRLALGTLLAADAAGLDVPGRLLVAAGTDSEAARTASPPLTALDLAPERIGRLAVETLVALIDGREPQPRRLVVPTRLHARDSSRAGALSARG